MKYIIRWLRRRFTARPVPVESGPLRPVSLDNRPPVAPYVPPTEAERMAPGDVARAERARLIAAQVHVNEFADTPEEIAARRADPNWREEQLRKNEVAAQKWLAHREAVGMPVIRKER